MSILNQNTGGIGKSIPSALKISLDPLLGVADGFLNTPPCFGGARIQSQFCSEEAPDKLVLGDVS